MKEEIRHFVRLNKTVKEIKENGEKRLVLSIYTSYLLNGNDIMRKGGKFYAVYDQNTGMWSKEHNDVYRLIDEEIRKYIVENFKPDPYIPGGYVDQAGRKVIGEYLNVSSTGRLKEFNVWFSNLPDNHNYVQLDQDLTFKSDEVTFKMYRSKRLGYDIGKSSIEAYDKIMSTLYSEEDRQKIEWSIGAVIDGEAKDIEKILVLYGDPGSGKSTILDLIKMMFDGYWVVFIASDLVSNSKQFATASFKDNPLVAIQDDGSMEKIESPIINEIISHKDILINEKGKQQYTIRSNAFLFLATNKTVDIHDTKLGISRRLLDVYPSGRKLPVREYDLLKGQMTFEIPGIAYHCLEVFKELGKHYYTLYKPERMIQKTNYLRNFLFDNLEKLSTSTFCTRDELYTQFKMYCDESGLGYPPKRIAFNEQLKEYFEEYTLSDRIGGVRRTHIFRGIKINKILGIDEGDGSETDDSEDLNWLKFVDATSEHKSGVRSGSLLDASYMDCPAQYAVVGGERDGLPERSWAKCKTKLKDIDPFIFHWFKLPQEVIKIDFDKRGPDGEKNLEENIKAASKFPKTYAEVSMSGNGIHLYYIYDGDASKLSRIYDENIEVKVDCPHRRILTKCVNLPIAHISSGLPLKPDKIKMDDVPINVKSIRTTIKRCLAKEIHADTTSNIDWIHEILERAYVSGIKYDVSDMADDIREFASKSTHQSEKCLRTVDDMKFKSLESVNDVDLSGSDQNEKGVVPTIDEKVADEELNIRNAVKEVLNKGTPATATAAVTKIKEILKIAEENGFTYDISDLRQELLIFAGNANDQKYCMKVVRSLNLCTEVEGMYDNGYASDAPFMFFDYEVFPNLIVLCYKFAGEDKPVLKMINPTAEEIADVFGIGKRNKPRAIGFNCKEYDNHITYAIYMGKSVHEVFLISQAIINKDKNAKFREAKHLSYTDILDYCPDKISLKKWEIKLKIHHQELGLPWDKPVPESLWPTVADYCVNDVIATEAVFNATAAAYKGRLILVDLANILMGPGSVPNDSTNELTTKLIVGNERNPQKYFIYPNLAEEFPGYEFDQNGIDKDRYISKDVIISGKSIYRGYDPGEGGFVWAKPGMYGLSESDDSASHHPSTIIAKNGFGKFTPNFKRLLDLRLMIKHKEYDKLRGLYDGALAKYLESAEDAKALSFALKIAINSVYGLTAAKFPNALRDGRNIDNWVAKRGALFMIDLMLNVQEMGYTVLHCKTDSIKILNPDDTVRKYIYDYGKKFGYTFEVEHRFERLCLVNDAVYVCKYTDEEVNEDEAGKWSATGKQFQVPYVFKMLFSHEPIEFDDMCETKNTSTALYLDFNEDLQEGEHNYHFVGKTGQFSPVKPGCGGGVLLREKDGKYYAAESTTGFRWLESEAIRKLKMEDCIDQSFYKKQVDKAVDTISKFGSFDAFTAEGPYVDMSFMNIPETDEEEIPFA